MKIIDKLAGPTLNPPSKVSSDVLFLEFEISTFSIILAKDRWNYFKADDTKLNSMRLDYVSLNGLAGPNA